MKGVIQRIRSFFASMGLVEQAQVVASTAVVVAMVTIVLARMSLRQNLGTLDFISVITVGVIGYVSVYFSLKYGRSLEKQRRELLELNTITDAVNRSVELNTVLHSALVKVMELKHADAGWIYLQEESLTLRDQHRSSGPLFPDGSTAADPRLSWIKDPGVHRTDDPVVAQSTSPSFAAEGLKVLASIPLMRQDAFAGVLVIGSKDPRTFEAKRIAVIQAFGHQISAALSNASLFEQVLRSEQLYADLYDHSPDMYHTVDRDGVVLSCNATESRLLGIPKQQIVGRPVLNLYPPSQHRQVRENLEKIFQFDQELGGFEEQIVRNDGTLIDVSVNTSLIRDSDGVPRAARMVLRDITEKKRLEEKILQAQKIDSIGNLAGGIAHDFNNILTAILSSASIMRRRMDEDQRWLKYVDLIETTSRRGAAVTRQLLTFARKSNPHVERIDVNSAIEQTLRLFEVTCPRSIHIKRELAPVPLMTEADEGQLQQAFLNLCLNARDAMPDGGILVIRSSGVSVGQEEARELTRGITGEFVEVSFTDSGLGIPLEHINRIYEPFFTTKEQGKGTGLGLSVVYGVIGSHNGHISVSSEVNSGTVFTVLLPRAEEYSPPESRPRKGSEPVVGGSERILLIEDESAVGEVGADILADLGYRADIARNGREAIERLAETSIPYDLVILDLNMPRLGGRAAFDRIKELFPELKVLVCSGYSASMLDDGKFATEIDGFIQKPYELSDIAEKIRSILDGS